MTDEFTRFSAGAIITGKAAATQVFMKHSIAIFDVPKKNYWGSMSNLES